MSYKIISKFSTELTDNDWLQIRESFNLVFKKDMSVEFFKKKYTDCSLGYSTHGILYHDNKIVGCFTIIPREYSFFNKIESIGLACDAYILEGFRQDELFLRKISESAILKISSENVNKLISLPNPDAYKYWKYLSNWKDIGELNYYAYPVNLSKIIFKKLNLSYLSFIISYVASYVFKFIYLFSNKSETKNIFIKFDNNSINHRFNLNDYKFVSLNKLDWGYYRVNKEEDLNVAYIIHVNCLSKKNLANMINKIIKQNRKKIDIIMYIGNPIYKPFNLFKVPKKMCPRKLIFTGLCENNKSHKENSDFLSLNNWEVGLVNFDNR